MKVFARKHLFLRCKSDYPAGTRAPTGAGVEELVHETKMEAKCLPPPVWAIIAHPGGLEQLGGTSRRLLASIAGLAPRPDRSRSGGSVTSMTLKRLWLTFAQAATIALGVLFVVTTLRPEWLAMRDAPSPVFVKQAAPTGAPVANAGSYSEAVGRAAPAVVNIFTSGAVKQRHPFAEDPIFRRFFSEMLDQPRPAASLGSPLTPPPHRPLLP